MSIMWAVEKEQLGRVKMPWERKYNGACSTVDTMDEVKRHSKCLQGLKLRRLEEEGH